ncbi:MAG: vitamin K epoxide reductase family protein [Patescibacteria group bacterium]|nr:vitamin K epoxide reductase family protein [Patescibacteria group bacterium]
MLNETAVWKTIKILAIVGIFLASYLFYDYLAYNVFSLPPLKVCNISSVINCDASTKGPISTFIGIPVALYGLVGYFVILFSALTRRKKLALGMTTFGLLFCLRITFIEVLQLHVICPVCLGCQIVMLTVFILALYLNYSKNKPIVSAS